MRSEVDCPSGWKTIALGELVDFQKGRKVETFEAPMDGAIPYLGAAAFSHPPTRWTASEDVITCREDDTLLLWDGERSGLSISGLSGALSSTVVRLRPCSRKIHPGFLSVAIHDCYDWIQHRRTGSGIPHVPKDLPSILRLWLPPLPEQKKIAAILASVDEAIQATRAVIEQTRRVKEGLLQDLLTRGIGHTRFQQTEIGEIPEGWECLTVRKCLNRGLFDLVKDGNHGAQYPRSTEFSDQGTPFLAASSISDDGHIAWEEVPHLPARVVERLRIPPAHGGDVILTHNASVGKVATLPDSLGRVVLGTSTTTYRCVEPGLTRHYLAAYFRSEPYQAQLRRVMAQTTRNQVPISAQRELHIPVPPPEEQSLIAERAKAAERSLKATQSELSAQLRIKAGLLQDLLSGKVRVTV